MKSPAAMRAALGDKLTPSEAALLGNSASALAPARADRRQPSLEAEKPFLADDDAAMTKMMNDMAVKPTGDVDRDFVAMMVPATTRARSTWLRPNRATAMMLG